ncbi:MAG: hypothetical protein ACR2QX_13700 [Woeseiaceae bacterium]
MKVGFTVILKMSRDAPKLSRLSETDNFCHTDSLITDAIYVHMTCTAERPRQALSDDRPTQKSVAAFTGSSSVDASIAKSRRIGILSRNHD